MAYAYTSPLFPKRYPKGYPGTQKGTWVPKNGTQVSKRVPGYPIGYPGTQNGGPGTQNGHPLPPSEDRTIISMIIYVVFFMTDFIEGGAV